MTSAGFDSTEIGFIEPGGGGGAVDTVNGVAPVLGDVTLSASDIPSTGPSDVQTDLDALKYIESAADLQARFPAAGGVHTVDQGSEWRLPKGVTKIDIGSNTIVGVFPGGITFIGGQGTITTNVDATLASGELACSNVLFENTNAGASALCVDFEGLFGRFAILKNWGVIGLHLGRIANVVGAALYDNPQLKPTAPGATSLEIDGTNGAPLFVKAIAITPGTIPFAGIRVLPTASVGVFAVQTSVLQSAAPGDALIYIDPGFSIPPTNVISVTSCSSFGPGDVFDSTGLGPGDVEVLSLNNINAPSSKWLGDLVYDSLGGAAISLTMSGGVEVMPSENAGPTAQAAITTGLFGSQRFDYAPTALQDWELISKSRNDGVQGEVSWRAQVKRNGGTIRDFTGWVQWRTGPDPAVWTTIAESKGERSLNTTYDSVGGSAPFQWGRTTEFRLVVLGTVATDTDVKDWRLQIGQGRP